VVRPVARFRPAARRSGASLEPVYLITQLTTDTGIDRVVEVHTGSGGKIAEFVPWQLGTAPVASSEDPGFVSSTIAGIQSFWAALGFPITITGSGWSGSASQAQLHLFNQVVDGVLYVSFLRGAYFVGAFYVNAENALPGSPYTQQDDGIISSASYDLLTIAVDLENGSISSIQVPFFTSGLSDVQVGVLATSSASMTARYTRSGTYAGIKEGLGLSLPAVHPFKSCGASAWAYLSNLDTTTLGDYSYTASTNTALPALITSGSNVAGRDVAAPAWFAITRQPFLAQAVLLNMGGYSSTLSQRVLRGSGSVNELSTLDPIWSSCTGYSLLGRFVATSFVDYSAEEVQDLETLLDLSDLPAVDQEGLVTTPTPPATAPTGSVPAGSEAYTTTDPVFFMSSNYRPSFAGSALISTYFTHYWIRD